MKDLLQIYQKWCIYLPWSCERIFCNNKTVWNRAFIIEFKPKNIKHSHLFQHNFKNIFLRNCIVCIITVLPADLVKKVYICLDGLSNVQICIIHKKHCFRAKLTWKCFECCCFWHSLRFLGWKIIAVAKLTKEI